MKIEEFKEELSNIDVADSRWKNKMMTVTKLYKSLGYELKDAIDEEKALLHNVYFYASSLLEGIIQPTVETFYMHVLLQNEVLNKKNIEEKLTSDRILKMYENRNKPVSMESDEEFLNYIYNDIGVSCMSTLIKNQGFIAHFVEYLNSECEITSITSFLADMTKEGKDTLKYVFDYVANNETAKKAFKTIFISEIMEYEKNSRLDIKESLIKRITTITNFLNQCGYLDEVMETNNSLMNQFDIPMKVSKEENKIDFNINNLISKEYYKQFDTEELFVLSAFYTNRLEKIMENINDGIYLHLKLGTFYDSIAYDEIPEKIDSRDAKVVLKQKYFLENLSREEFKNLKNSVTNETTSDDLNFGVVPESLVSEYKKVYNEYFDRYMPKANNDFENDYRFTFMNKSVAYCMYALKDFSIESLLYTLSQNKSKINFGLIKENRVKRNEYGEEQVLIGVDYKEFPTMRIHFPKVDYDEFVSEFFPDGDFPEYIGNGDFNVNGTEIKTQLLYKFAKKQKQALKKRMEEEYKKDPNSDIYKFLRHIYENIHPKQNKLNKKSDQSDDFGDK